MPTVPGGPGTVSSPGRGKVSVVGAPEKVSTTTAEPYSKSTSPVNDLPTGAVAGGAGVELITRHPEPVCWVPAVTVAVIAPESASVPFGDTDPPCVPDVEAGAAELPPERSIRLRPTGTAMITAAATATIELSSHGGRSGPDLAKRTRRGATAPAIAFSARWGGAGRESTRRPKYCRAVSATRSSKGTSFTSHLLFQHR